MALTTARIGRWGALAAVAAAIVVVPGASATACWWIFKANGEARRPAPAPAQPVAANEPFTPAPAPPPPAPRDDRRAEELERQLAERDAENRRLRDDAARPTPAAAPDPRLGDLERRLADRDAENRRLRDELDRRLADRDAEARRLRDELATRPAAGALPREQVDMTLAERDAELARLRRELDKERAKPAPVIVQEPFGKGTTSRQTDEQIVIAIEDGILFDSGKADIKPGARTTLDRIHNFIRERYSANQVEVVGHTDVQPIRHSGWQDNWHLSIARSTAVARDLMRQGVRPDLCKISGRGEFEPVSNDWALNRRVEIVIWLKKFDPHARPAAAPVAARRDAPIFK